MKKKIDPRIKSLIDRCVHDNQRGLIILVGDRGVYQVPLKILIQMKQVVNLHQLVAKAQGKAQPSVLWCYKKELEFSSNKKKRLKQVRKKEQAGNLDKEELGQIELFMTSKDIRFCYYKDTHKVLGKTFGMCVIQDFESVTPNVLCRTIETVQGGGLVVLLFNTMASLRQLYTISMDVHARFRTESHQLVEPRFNERFILSLKNCNMCLAMDDELNILPITPEMNKLQQQAEEGAGVQELYLSKEQVELKNLKQQLKDTKPIGNMVGVCKTLDQAKAVMQIIDVISEKDLKTTLSLTAGRGRGKSSALGICLAGSIVYGYSNIFVTAPSPENLQSVFEFVFKGLDALNYAEHKDYEIIQSTNPEFNGAIVRVNIFRDHRQTIQYIRPQDYNMLAQAELLVVDEAAAIPITIVKELIGPYLVLMSSTVNGYEGTGRSLSLKLVQQLREQNRMRTGGNQYAGMGRKLLEVQLEEPIRYSLNDSVEKWLNDLLCLNATSEIEPLEGGLPHPNSCDLYFVNRDTLFSFHPSSEKFLNKLMSIFVSSHYKNSPNDLQLLSDAPAHQIFVLLGPISGDPKQLPDILCAVQICFEGDISKQTISENMKKGHRPSGDLIPWLVSEQFQDESFASLCGARIIRIATHPNAQGKGYGSRALELLIKYYEGALLDQDQLKCEESKELFAGGGKSKGQAEEGKGLQEEVLKPKKHLKPILQKLAERKPLQIHYLGTSFGITKELFGFWRKNGFAPIYLRQTMNELTGEHTCVMLRPMKLDYQEKYEDDEMWAKSYTVDFRKRLVSLLGYEFRSLPSSLALALVKPDLKKSSPAAAEDQGQFPEHLVSQVGREALEGWVSVFDLKRLESYAKNLVDFHLVMDLVPTLSKMYFLNQILPKGLVTMSYLQSAILVGLGLQFKTVDQLQAELDLQANQILPLFNKVVKKFTRVFRKVYESEAEKQLQLESRSLPVALNSEGLKQGLLDELALGEDKVTKQMKQEKEAFIKHFKKHAISQTKEDFEKAVGGHKGGQLNVVSVEKRKREEADLEELEGQVKKNKGNKRARHN